MTHSLVKTAALALALGGFATAAYAVSPLPLQSATPLAHPVIDEETAVEEMERPDEVPPGSQKESAPPNSEMQPGGAGGGASDAEINELQQAFPSTDWPSDRAK